MIPIRLTKPDPESLREAGAILRAGGLVAFPTETVYGLGANGWDRTACRKIFAAKGRPEDNPLILHVVHIDQAVQLAQTWPPLATALAKAFWPGPLTLVVLTNPGVPDVVRAGLSTVAVRCPDHPVARSLLEEAKVPVAAPSANRSGRPSPTSAESVAEDLGEHVDMILDGGFAGIGVESTVVDVSGSKPVLLRPGGLAAEAIEAITGPLLLPDPGGPARAPGMKYRHYAPTLPVILLKRSGPEAAATVREHFGSVTTGVLAPTSIVNGLQDYPSVDLGEDDRTAAERLFRGLRTLDQNPKLTAIVAVWNNPVGLGLAVLNRLEKAAAEVWT